MLLTLKLLLSELKNTDKIFYRDARTSHLPLVGSPIPMAIVLMIYLLFVKKWGPAFMAKRKPYNVKLAMQIYNIFQVLLNFYVFIEISHYSFMQSHFNTSCQEYNPQDMRRSNMLLRYPVYAFYISKYFDLLDTVFFVLRKKYNQISFLHVYHHTLMVYALWCYLTLLFASHYTATGYVNAFIHVCMYSYYFVAAAKIVPEARLYHWKRRLTQIQILQFLFLSYHFLQPLLNNWCKLDLFWSWVSFLNNLLILVLFTNFYIKSYIIRKPVKNCDANEILKIK